MPESVSTVRLLLLRAHLSPRRRLLVLESMLAVSAAAAAAAIGSAHGWAAVICILLVGNPLWALEFELRGTRVSA